MSRFREVKKKAYMQCIELIAGEITKIESERYSLLGFVVIFFIFCFDFDFFFVSPLQWFILSSLLFRFCFVFLFVFLSFACAVCFFPLQNTLRKHSCLDQHIKLSPVGLVKTPVTNCDYEWHPGDPGVAVAQAHKHKLILSQWFTSACTHTHKLKPTRLLTWLNFRAHPRWASWRVIWLLRRAASSVCARKLQLWHSTTHHTHNTHRFT